MFPLACLHGQQVPLAGTAPRPKTVPATVKSDAIATVGPELQECWVIPRKQVFSWASYGWGNQPFDTVILTALHLTTDVFIDPQVAALGKCAISTRFIVSCG